MAKQTINTGAAADDGTGDPLRTAMGKANANFTELYDSLSAKANLASPALTGAPTAPTATAGTNTTQIATTAFVLANAGTGGSAPNVSLWPILIAEIGHGNGQSVQSLPASTFTTIALNVVVDTHSGWNGTDKWWTVPAGQGGVYEVAGKYRLVDGVTAGQSIGIGMHTALADHAAFFWDNTVTNRQGIQTTRLISLNAGQTIRLFAWLQSAMNLAAGSLTIQRIR